MKSQQQSSLNDRWVNEWMKKWMYERMTECMNQTINKQIEINDCGKKTGC